MKISFYIVSAFFLINLSCAQPQKFEANLPAELSKVNQNDSQVVPASTNPVIIIISEKMEVFLQEKDRRRLLGKTDEAKKLKESFSDLLKEKEDKTVFLKTPRSVKYGDATAVIDILKAAGAKPIGLQIDELEK